MASADIKKEGGSKNVFFAFVNVSYVSIHSLFGHMEEEYIPDAESVYLHREQHHHPQTCSLAQCFQLYTREEQVTEQKHTNS